MECNRDEAIRAKTIAEEKLEKKDFAGAKKFALKAQCLYPQLEGISHMLTTIDVYISAESKISGEVDWYGVLGVNPAADDETVRKQYRKLALVLHPDKNKSAGADGAFKLICEAWSLLSDKSNRLAYNMRRCPKGFQKNVSTHTGGSSAPPQKNGYHSYTSRTSSTQKTPHSNTRVPPTSVPRPSYQRTDTFWTICHQCKMHYEYLKVYLNHTLLCPNCHKAFLASETAPPFNYSKSSNSSSRHRHQHSGNYAPTGHQSFNNSNFQQDPLSRTANVGSMDPSIAVKAANVVQQAHEKMKRERDTSVAWEGNPGYNSSFVGEGHYKKTRLNDDGYCYEANMTYNRAMGNGVSSSTSASTTRKGGFEPDRMHGSSGSYSKPNISRELTPVEIRNMLMVKARKEILKKLDDLRSQAATKAADKEKLKVKLEKERSTNNVSGRDQNGTVESSAIKIAGQAEKPAAGIDAGDPGNSVTTAMNVPDPDFHDFDLDRTESSFGDNEVWASYDGDDGMPRFYAMINKVISRNPFKVRINWLNSKTTSEFGTLDWVSSGFYKTCGEFRLGKYELNNSINSFSHKVKWSKGPRGVVHIFPKKGDVWALYKNWSPDWDENTPDEVIHKYDMVVVLDDYNEVGVSVAPLIKVAGFKTVFLPHSDPEKVQRILKEEMFRFSHQVPNYLLSGEEAQNAPKGCLELDPAATPLELLQVLNEHNRRDVYEQVLPNLPETRAEANKGDVKENVLPNPPEIRIDEVAGGVSKTEEEEVEEIGESGEDMKKLEERSEPE